MKITVSALVCVCLIILCVACTGVEKNISVVAREKGSGTREAFDRAVGDGEHFLEERSAEGKKVYNTVKTAIEQTKTGTVLSIVGSDVNAIGYVSVGSLGSTVKAVSIDGVLPTEQSVLNGTYKIQRPFVIMTRKGQDKTPLASDFLQYLKSDASRAFAQAAGCIFLEDEQRRGGTPTEHYEKSDTLPSGDKIVLRGSTSLEKFINSAARAYADMYGADASDIFDLSLEGSSVGRKAVENDTRGNVIGLSSASVDSTEIDSFCVCADAIAVIVNNENPLSDLSLAELYGIFSGRIQKFSELSVGET